MRKNSFEKGQEFLKLDFIHWPQTDLIFILLYYPTEEKCIFLDFFITNLIDYLKLPLEKLKNQRTLAKPAAPKYKNEYSNQKKLIKIGP